MASIFKKNGKGPWVITYFDAQGRRRECSSRTTDYRIAQRIAAQLSGEVSLRRKGVIDARTDRFAAENARPLRQHVDDYLAHLAHARRSPLTLRDAKSHLNWILDTTGAVRLSDLGLDAVERALATLQVRGLSARTVNHHGGSVRAFLSWAMKSGKLDSNPLRYLPRQAESIDRRRERRAISDKEVLRLIAVARANGRLTWYMLALFAGLRLSELRKLTWGDVNLPKGVLTIGMGKAKRLDEVPLHADLAAELARVRPADATSTTKVFRTAVTNATRRRDFANAEIQEVDEDGRHADLHSLRSTLGTRLARQGVTPQVAQRIMRHSDYRTTVKHYVRLELSDTAAAVRGLPSINEPQPSPQQYPQQSLRETAHFSAG